MRLCPSRLGATWLTTRKRSLGKHAQVLHVPRLTSPVHDHPSNHTHPYQRQRVPHHPLPPHAYTHMRVQSVDTSDVTLPPPFSPADSRKVLRYTCRLGKLLN